jgi:hypothetical protein
MHSVLSPAALPLGAASSSAVLSELEEALDNILLIDVPRRRVAEYQGRIDRANGLDEAALTDLFAEAVPGSGASSYLAMRLTRRGIPPSARRMSHATGDVQRVLLDADWLGYRYPRHRTKDGDLSRLASWGPAEAKAALAHWKSGAEAALELGLSEEQQRECIWFGQARTHKKIPRK